MKQVTRSLLGFALSVSVAGILVAYALWTTNAPPPSAVVANARAFDFNRKDVFAIDIVKGAQTIHVEQNGGAWFVQSPVQMQAADEKVSGLIDTIVGLQPAIPWTGAEDAPKPDEVGLSTSGDETLVKLWDAKQSPIASVQFGTLSDYNQMRYAAFRRSTDAPMLGMLPQATLQSLIPTLQAILERRVLGTGHQQVLRLQVRFPQYETEGRSFTLERARPTDNALAATDRFVLRMPQRVDADTHRANDLLRAFSATPVAKFLSFQHENRFQDFSLEPAAIEVEVELATTGPGGTPQKLIRKLRIGHPKENPSGVSTVWVASDSPAWVGEVNAALYYALMASPSDLVDTRILQFESRNVFGVVLTENSFRAAYERQQDKGGNVWRNINSGMQIDATKIQTLLLTFSDLFGETRLYPDDDEKIAGWLVPYGLDEKSASRLTFSDAKGEVIAELLLGNIDGDARLVRPAQANWVARLPIVKLQTLPASPEDFRIQSPQAD